MKKFVALPLLLFLTFACSTVYIPSQNKVPSIERPDHYKDRIYFLKLEKSDTSQWDKIKDKVTEEFNSISKQNYDAVIYGFNTFQWMSSPSSDHLTYLELVSIAGELAHQNGIRLLLDINLEENNKREISPSELVTIKNNTYQLVKNCNLDGFYFSGIDFSSVKENDLFENIVVESMLLKPFLIMSAHRKLNNANSEIIENYLKTGIVDFLIDENANYSITGNTYINISTSEKLLTQYIRRISPEHFFRLNLSEVADNNENIVILNENRIKQITPDKKVNFWLTDKSDSIKIKIGGNTFNLSKADWVIPYNYLLHPDDRISRYGTWVEFRRPFEKITSNNIYNLLCRTNYPSDVLINDEPVHIYKTGVFFKKIKLNEGLNKIRAEVKSENGQSAIYEDRVLFKKKDPSIIDTNLAIHENSIQPVENLTLMPKDFLTVSFNGSKSQNGFVEINPGAFLFECRRKDFSTFSRYEIQIPLNNFVKNQKYNIKLVLKPNDIESDQKPVEKNSGYYLLIKDFGDFPLLTTTQNNSIFNFTLAPIRLGAPIRNELPKDVILKSNGIFGDYYRIYLNDIEEGYISREFVKEIPDGSVTPSYFINPITCYPTETADIIRIPYLENVPYDVFADPEQNRITINLYGVKTSSTWIIHRTEPRYIEELTWQQATKETYKIFVNLKTSKIWGYELKPNGKELIFKLKYPPKYDLENPLPLKGIKISIEAGHGGSNTGAIGLSGLKEKEINLDLSKKMEELFKTFGAEVLQVRDSDKDMTLLSKREIATNSDANLHLSIHANASEPVTEFLGASGTCTFYHNPFWAPLAENIYKRLIELDLKPFGTVGSFNYRVTRMSEMPSILVEQAFMSHAEDEEKLADDNFRTDMAYKIYLGILDYLKYMNN
jgi:N-acetylmuramoyl-L-alanine amidase